MAEVKVLHRGYFKTVGEGPVWLEQSNELVFIDMFENKAVKLNATTNELSECVVPGKFLKYCNKIFGYIIFQVFLASV